MLEHSARPSHAPATASPLVLHAAGHGAGKGLVSLVFPKEWKIDPIRVTGAAGKRLHDARETWQEMAHDSRNANPIFAISSAIELAGRADRFVMRYSPAYELQLVPGTIDRLAARLEKIIEALPDKELKQLFQCSEIIPGLKVIEMPSEPVLAATFLRFQERYESPNPDFQGKAFTLAEYSKWYKSSYTSTRGEFSYYGDWAGFNLPGEIFAPHVVAGMFPLARREKALVNLVHESSARDGRQYIIGVGPQTEQGRDNLRHEVRHGLFYLDSQYKEEVLQVLKNLDLSGLRTWLYENGYSEKVADDECQAYLGGSLKELAIVTGLDMSTPRMKAAHAAIKEAEHAARIRGRRLTS